MNKWMETHLGKSWKTTLVSYVMAVMLAVQPFLDQEVDFTNKHKTVLFIVKIVFAGGIALFGKIAADSAQVKEVHNDVQKLKNE
jgi:hypothetical protein